MSPFLSLTLTSAMVLSPTPVSLTQDLALTLELKTAAICLIVEGVPAEIAVPELYRFLEQDGIRHPAPGSQAATEMWRKALDRATPAKCDQILRNAYDI